jgi:methionyl-tRNA formyltransferase
MRIVFMGTPEFAVPSLHAIKKSSHELAGVVTAPDKPVGRGLKVQPSPVKQVALNFSVPTFQPNELNDPEFIAQVTELHADLFVVVAFRILPASVFGIPPKGTINLHASLLPKYRGAAPINWAIINGENETGVTTIFIQEKVDAGDLILQKRLAIGDEETAGELHDRLSTAGAELLRETIDLIAKGIAPRRQQTGEPTRAPKLTKELMQIDWQRPAARIKNLIRGLSPSPGAFTFLHGKILKILRARLAAVSELRGKPGEVIRVDLKTGQIVVASGVGDLEIIELQLEGKRSMSAKEFLLGHALKAGERLG